MRPPLRLLKLGLVLLLLVLPALAYAQAPGPTPPPVLTPSVALMLVLSVGIGILTQIVQTGGIFGIVTTPKTWLPVVTVLGTFLGGVYAYFAGLGSAFVVDGTTIVYGLVAGFGALLAGTTPGLVVHAHVVTPAKLCALRLAKLGKPTGGAS